MFIAKISAKWILAWVTQVGSTGISSAGAVNIFVAKIDADGTWVWATRAGGTGNGRGISDGSFVVNGQFESNATFGTTTLSSAGGVDIFVAHYPIQHQLLQLRQHCHHNNDQLVENCK